jgi:hypothetical protein
VLVGVEVVEDEVSAVVDRGDTVLVEFLDQLLLGHDEDVTFLQLLGMDLFGFIVEIQAFVLGDLVLAGVEDHNQIVVQFGEVVQDGGDGQAEEVLLGDEFDEESLDGGLQGVFAHFTNRYAFCLQSTQLLR